MLLQLGATSFPEHEPPLAAGGGKREEGEAAPVHEPPLAAGEPQTVTGTGERLLLCSPSSVQHLCAPELSQPARGRNSRCLHKALSMAAPASCLCSASTALQ